MWKGSDNRNLNGYIAKKIENPSDHIQRSTKAKSIYLLSVDKLSVVFITSVSYLEVPFFVVVQRKIPVPKEVVPSLPNN